MTKYQSLFDLGVADRHWHEGYRLSFQRFQAALQAKNRRDPAGYEQLLRKLGPHHMSSLEALAASPSDKLPFPTTRQRLYDIRLRMKEALDALEQAFNAV
jgi:hypothetical protein